MAEECLIVKKNLGITKCKALPQLWASYFTTPANFVIPKDTVDVAAFLQEAMLNPDPSQRVYLWPAIVSMEDAKEDAVYEETPNADLTVRPGKYRWRAYFKEDLCTHKAMNTHSGSGDRIIPVDIAEQMFGTETTNGGFAGFTISNLNVEKMIISDGSASTKTPVYIVLKNSKQIDKKGLLMDASFVDDLIKLTDVDVTAGGTQTATTLKVSVKTSCDGINVPALVLADFIKLKVDGTPETLTALVYANGIYTLTGVALTSGTVSLVPSDELSVQGFEAAEPATITIP